MPSRSLRPCEAVDPEGEKGELDQFLEDSVSSDVDGFSPEDVPRFKPHRRALAILPWLLSTLFCLLSLILLFERSRRGTAFGSYETVFDTDLILGSNIPLEKIRFKGSPHFHANGTGFLDPLDETAPWPENMVLFGPPSREVDENWERLIGKRYFSISEDEADRAWGERRQGYVDQRLGGYTAGLEVFHTLHCVNALRKALQPEYYHGKHNHGRFHVEHCLDAIRQTIQCYGSTTLIPTKFREGLHHNYIDSDQIHTCRSFNFLRDFVDSRAKGQPAYVERDESTVDERKHHIASVWDETRKHSKHKSGH